MMLPLHMSVCYIAAIDNMHAQAPLLAMAEVLDTLYG
jgi:hypothetical protein